VTNIYSGQPELAAATADVPPPDDAAAPRSDTEAPCRVPLVDRLLSVSDLASLPPVVPLIDGLLYRGTLAQLAGPPGCYKSFLAVGMACAVAVGATWEGYRVPEAGKVVYVAAEGATGLRVRILAWCEANGTDPADLDGRLFVLPCPIQLGNTLDVTEAIDLVRHVGADLLVLDTRARCTLGLEENSATEQSKAIAAAEVIQQAAECAVLGVHHSARNGSAGRGSNAWDGAVWTDLRITGENLAAAVHVEKHKDVPAGMDHLFHLMPHTVSVQFMPDCSETQRMSLVVVQNDGGTNLADSAESARAVLDVIGTSDGPDGLTRPEIIRLAEARNVSRSAAYRAVKTLLDNGSIRNIGTDKRARYVATAATTSPLRLV